MTPSPDEPQPAHGARRGGAPLPAQPSDHPLARAIDLGTSALFLLVAAGALDVLLLARAWGGWRPVLAHRPAVAMLVAWAIAGLAGAFAHPRSEPRPVRRGRESPWVVPALTVLPFVGLFVSAWSERHGLLLVPGGAGLAWFGVVAAAAGASLRALAVAQLGRHFSPHVLVQEDHALHHWGVYRRIRHPSYLGALLNVAGAALVFRSTLGLAVALVMWVPVQARVRVEERLLAEHFGTDYDDYRRRTGSLLPRLGRRPGHFPGRGR
jgi:protein-S-isoprenylcysteine O-methyltransferase Ste14